MPTSRVASAILAACLCAAPAARADNVMCCDGTRSPTCTYAHRGCCSHHGGVCDEDDEAPARAPRDPPRRAPPLRLRGTVRLASVRVVGGEGELADERLAAALDAELDALRVCYSDALRTSPTTGGRVEVRFSIGTSGRTNGATTTGADASPAVTCATTFVRGAEFPPPAGGAVDAVVVFDLEPPAPGRTPRRAPRRR